MTRKRRPGKAVDNRGRNARVCRKIKISLAKNLTTEELLAEMEKKLDCKAWIDKAGEWHLKPNKKS
jgi:hypothetical protein